MANFAGIFVCITKLSMLSNSSLMKLDLFRPAQFHGLGSRLVDGQWRLSDGVFAEAGGNHGRGRQLRISLRRISEAPHAGRIDTDSKQHRG